MKKNVSITKQKEKKEELTISEWLKNINYNYIIFIAFAIIAIIAAVNHEPWRDEAQSYLISRDLNFIKLLGQLKYDGHPFLWYYIQKIFIFLHLPYEYFTILPVTISFTGIFLFLKNSPNKYLVNIVTIFSPTIIFYSTIFNRSYSLMLLLMVFLLLLYEKKEIHPYLYGITLFCLANTHVLAAGFVCTLILIEIYDTLKDKENKKNHLIILGISALGIICLILQMLGFNNSSVTFLGEVTSSNFFEALWKAIKNIILTQTSYEILFWISLISIIIYLLYLVKIREYRIFIILLLGLGYQIFVSTFIYPVVDHKALMFYLTIAFCTWQFQKKETIPQKSKKVITILTIIIFGSTLYNSYDKIISDYKYLLSDSKNIAHYIKFNVKEGSRIYCTQDLSCTSIIPYLEKGKYTFIDYETENEFTFTDFSYYDYFDSYKNNPLNANFFNKENMDYYIGTPYQEYYNATVEENKKIGYITSKDTTEIEEIYYMVKND